MTHSLTPWKLDAGEGIGYIADKNGNEIFRLYAVLSKRNQEDIEFLLRCVNVSNSLLETLDLLETASRRFASGFDSEPSYVLSIAKLARTIISENRGK